jgi:hypothetical protein
LTTLRTRLSANIYRGVGLVDIDLSATAPISWDFSDTNRPTAYTSVSDWESRIPSGTPRVDIQTGSSDFYTNLANTVNAATGPVLINLGVGDYVLDQFRMIGASGDPTYAFGFWFGSKFRGFTGKGYDKTFVSMKANSMSQAQLDKLSTMTQASFAPNQMGMFRIDSSVAQPFFLGGLTIRADNQNPLTTIASDIVGVQRPTTPQPAPHQGPTIYGDSQNTGAGVLSHVRFQGAGKAWMSQPPFEMANFTSARSRITFYNCDFDGRISEAYDANRPRKCVPWMGNDEFESRMFDTYLHHSNVSRYAANDEGMSTAGRVYALTRCKVDYIAETQNDGNGGFTNATPLGWESTNAELIITDCIVVQRNGNTGPSGAGIAQHLQVTHVGDSSSDTSGGRMRVYGGTFKQPVWTQLDGWMCIRATIPSRWVTDGYDTTMFVYPNADGTGTRKQPWVYSGTWPPTAAQITAAGVTKDTHYLVRNS